MFFADGHVVEHELSRTDRTVFEPEDKGVAVIDRYGEGLRLHEIIYIDLLHQFLVGNDVEFEVMVFAFSEVNEPIDFVPVL